MRKLLILAALGLSVGAMAQSRSSFFAIDSFSGVNLAVTNGGLTYTLTMGAAPTMTVAGVSYDIQDIFGIWALTDSGNNLAATNQDSGVWGTWVQQGIAGWKTNPNTGAYPGDVVALTFDTLDVAHVDHQGFHVRCFGNVPIGGGNTGYAYAVPEPSSLLALGTLATLLVARRRRK